MGFVVDRVSLGQVSPPILRISLVIVIAPMSLIDIHSSALGAVYVTVLKFSGPKIEIKIMFGV
jgi:hypothetical protein